MPLDSSFVAVIAVAAVAVAILVALGVYLGFQIGKRAPVKSDNQLPDDEPATWRMPERVARELNHCRDLTDCVVRDADTLSAAAACCLGHLPREVEGALAQLRKTVKGLAGRMQQVSSDRPVTSSEVAAGSVAEAVERASLLVPAPVARPLAAMPTEQRPLPREPSPRGEDLRKFERKPCPGTLKATIYPPPFRSEAEPVHCDVITRDLSCGGVGIAHTEQLYPRQIVVLHAVSKVLIGEVRWCQKIDERSFIAGCQLIKAGG